MAAARGGGGRGRGRGAYYKARYGGGGRGGIHKGYGERSEAPAAITERPTTSNQARKPWDALETKLNHIDGRPYGHYNSVLGTFEHLSPAFTLSFDHVQSDPFASPSRVRVWLDSESHKVPPSLFETSTRRVALADFLTRKVAEHIRSKVLDKNLPNNPDASFAYAGGTFNISINAPGQEALPRTSCVVHATSGRIELRFTIRLPAQRRSVLAKEAIQILVQTVPDIVSECLLHSSVDDKQFNDHVRCIEQQVKLRNQLSSNGLVAFIGNGSILPRKSGFQSLPMTGPEVVPFQSPPEYEVELEGVDRESIVGMGIRKGVTVLTGGGFHGKSTVLEAVQTGIYDTIPGDGRELVVTDDTAFKIRAEDGRSVKGLDISPFIRGLPGKRSDTFSSEEALELGSKLLLIDEDSSATSLLVRDARMQELIKAEPITPLVSKVRALYEQIGVSSLIVIGGCGDYLSVADAVIGMDSYRPHDLTRAARGVVAKYPAAITESDTYGHVPERHVRIPNSKSIRFTARSLGFLEMKDNHHHTVVNPAEGKAGIDISLVEQLVEVGQTRFIAEALLCFSSMYKTGSLAETLSSVEKLLHEKGLDAVHSQGWPVGDFVWVRRFELGAAINRLRDLEVVSSSI